MELGGERWSNDGGKSWLENDDGGQLGGIVFIIECGVCWWFLMWCIGATRFFLWVEYR